VAQHFLHGVNMPQYHGMFLFFKWNLIFIFTPINPNPVTINWVLFWWNVCVIWRLRVQEWSVLCDWASLGLRSGTQSSSTRAERHAYFSYAQGSEKK
jgi:hypothetical protein